MKKKNFKYLEEFNRWCNGKFVFVSHYDFNLNVCYVLTDVNNHEVYNSISHMLITKKKGESTELFLKRIYGKDLECNGKVYHFPSSFEELCIINDLNGR